MAPTPLVVFGITGRMGQCVLRAVGEQPADFQLRDVLTPGAVALDFSVAAAVAEHARACAAAAVPLVVGATGFDAATQDELKRAAAKIAVLIAPNTSIAVALLDRLVAEVARALGSDYEVGISEAHHRHKVDAPSGTALALGATVAKARSIAPADIKYSVVREGDIVGEHTVTFEGPGERLELTHRATDRMTFARGALRAAAWLAGRPAGLYSMKDVLLV